MSLSNRILAQSLFRCSAATWPMCSEGHRPAPLRIWKWMAFRGRSVLGGPRRPGVPRLSLHGEVVTRWWTALQYAHASGSARNT
eukprot:4650998-Alexandrium_andersonii.AAC.1